MAYAFNNDKSKYDIDWIIDMIFKVSEAYAVFDSSDGSLTFFRDVPGKYTNEQVIETKTYYTGVENTSTILFDIPWTSKNSDIHKVKFENKIKPKNCVYWFFNFRVLESIENIKLLDTSKVTNMADMFRDCTSLTQLDLSSFDTSHVISMVNMFNGCSNLRQLDVSNFDTSSVGNMDYMFGYCENLTQLDVSNFDTSSVRRTRYMFKNCTNLRATLTIMSMPSSSFYYADMCEGASSQSGQLTLKYKAPVTSADIDTLVATKGNGNVVNGGPA